MTRSRCCDRIISAVKCRKTASAHTGAVLFLDPAAAIRQTRTMNRLLAIDLFCGLRQTKLLFCADAAIKQLVAGRAQNPDHVPLSVGGEPPCPVASELGFVRYLKNAAFSASLAGVWHLRVAAFQSVQCRVFKITSGLILRPALRVFSARPYPAQLASSFDCTISRAIPAVAVRWGNVKVRAAPEAIAAPLRRALVFFSANAPGTCCAIRRTPLFIWPNCLELRGALPAR